MFKKREQKPPQDNKPAPRQLGPMEMRVLLSTMVFMSGYAYYSLVRARLVPKTIKRLKEGFYPFHWSHLTQKHIYRMRDVQTVEHIIKANRNESKYYLLYGQKGKLVQ